MDRIIHRHKPNGRLRLAFDCMSHKNNGRKNWGDGNTQRLEDLVIEFLDGVGVAGGDGTCYIVRSDEKLTAFLEMERSCALK